MVVLAAVFILLLPSQAQQAFSAATPQSGYAVNQTNLQQEAIRGGNESSSGSQKSACTQCPNCCSAEQPYTKTKEEKAKADSLDHLTRCYMWATIFGVIGGIIGVCVLIWQSYL